MINVARIDLSVANTPDQAMAIQVNRPAWIRFHRVPSEVNLRMDSKSSTSFPVDQPFTINFCGQSPQTIYIDNEAGAGTLVILYGDQSQELDDFLASGGGTTAAWRAVAQLIPSSAGMFDLAGGAYTDPTQWGSTAGNVAWEKLLAGPYAYQGIIRYGTIAAGAAGEGYSLRTQMNAGSLIDYLFSTVAIVRDKSRVPSRRIELVCHIDSVIAGGNAAGLGVGFVNRVAGLETFGVGFFHSELVGGANLFAGVLDYSGGAAGDWPIPATRIIWQDTGIVANDFHGTLTVEIGQDAGDPYILWEIDGSEVYRHDGIFPSNFLLMTQELGDGIKVFKNVAADNYALRAVLWSIFMREAYL